MWLYGCRVVDTNFTHHESFVFINVTHMRKCFNTNLVGPSKHVFVSMCEDVGVSVERASSVRMVERVVLNAVKFFYSSTVLR